LTRSPVFLCAALAWAGLAAAGRAQEAAPSPQPTPTPSPSPTPEPLRPPTISGYAQFDERVADRAPPGVPRHEFNVRRARLTASGRVGEHVAYSFTYQGDGANVNTASLLDGQVEVIHRPWLKARLGQYKYDFDMEGRESDAGTPLPDRPFPTVAVAGGLTPTSTPSNPSGAFRDRGVTVGGSIERGDLEWGYAVGIFQGTGRESDNNNKPGYVLGAYLDPRPGLKINAGFLYSDNTPADEPVGPTYRAWTVGGAYDRGRVFVRGEYYRGRRQAGAVRQDLGGFYVLGSFTPAARLDLLARYHALRDDRYLTGSDHLGAVDLGVKVYLDRRERRSGTFLVASYSFRQADDGVIAALTLLNDGRGPVLATGEDVPDVFILRFQVRF
jgi:hypothetical protein